MIRGTDMEKDKNTNNYVFGLDIGTRSIVGVVGYLEYGRFKICLLYTSDAADD